MALENKMIEPFEQKLVRRIGDAPVISYGYDLRGAGGFKVLTNVFFAAAEPYETSYAERSGKYQAKAVSPLPAFKLWYVCESPFSILV